MILPHALAVAFIRPIGWHGARPSLSLCFRVGGLAWQRDAVRWGGCSAAGILVPFSQSRCGIATLASFLYFISALLLLSRSRRYLIVTPIAAFRLVHPIVAANSVVSLPGKHSFVFALILRQISTQICESVSVIAFADLFVCRLNVCCHLRQISIAGLEIRCSIVGGGMCDERLTTCIRCFVVIRHFGQLVKFLICVARCFAFNFRSIAMRLLRSRLILFGYTYTSFS